MIADHNQQRGEFVLVISGIEEKDKDDDQQVIESTLKVLLSELPLKQAVSLCVSLTGQPKNKVYSLALALQGKAE
jgi:16S rRNA (cytidine1402-2'-O)-methyltransferase